MFKTTQTAIKCNLNPIFCQSVPSTLPTNTPTPKCWRLQGHTGTRVWAGDQTGPQWQKCRSEQLCPVVLAIRHFYGVHKKVQFRRLPSLDKMHRIKTSYKILGSVYVLGRVTFEVLFEKGLFSNCSVCRYFFLPVRSITMWDSEISSYAKLCSLTSK